MEFVDRSAIPALHAAARRERAAYLGCLLAKLGERIAGVFRVRAAAHAVPCG